MRILVAVSSIALSGALLMLPTVASAGEVFLKTGKRFLVQTEGRNDYNPRIVSCPTSSIKLCLRDTTGDPPNNPIEPSEGGTLTVRFDAWKIIYIISPNGTGRTLNYEGEEYKPFKWSMVPI